jgi:hypothetical protein
MAVVQRFAGEVAASAGSCAVATRVAGEGGRLQWHILSDQG